MLAGAQQGWTAGVCVTNFNLFTAKTNTSNLVKYPPPQPLTKAQLETKTLKFSKPEQMKDTPLLHVLLI